MIGRGIAFDLSIPAKRPGLIDVPIFCQSVRETWRKLVRLTPYNNVAQTTTEDCYSENS